MKELPFAIIFDSHLRTHTHILSLNTSITKTTLFTKFSKQILKFSVCFMVHIHNLSKPPYLPHPFLENPSGKPFCELKEMFLLQKNENILLF